MNELVRQTVAFVQDHEAWAAPLLFALAFCESFAFIAVWVPFVSILLAVGAVLGASGLSFWPAWLGAILGAFAAQWLAYEMAFRLKGRVMRFWPLSRNEALVARGVAFFRRARPAGGVRRTLLRSAARGHAVRGGPLRNAAGQIPDRQPGIRRRVERRHAGAGRARCRLAARRLTNAVGF